MIRSTKPTKASIPVGRAAYKEVIGLGKKTRNSIGFHVRTFGGPPLSPRPIQLADNAHPPPNASSNGMQADVNCAVSREIGAAVSGS
jgi:hypothetical protein